MPVELTMVEHNEFYSVLIFLLIFIFTMGQESVVLYVINVQK